MLREIGRLLRVRTTEHSNYISVDGVAGQLNGCQGGPVDGEAHKSVVKLLLITDLVLR